MIMMLIMPKMDNTSIPLSLLPCQMVFCISHPYFFSGLCHVTSRASKWLILRNSQFYALCMHTLDFLCTRNMCVKSPWAVWSFGILLLLGLSIHHSSLMNTSSLLELRSLSSKNVLKSCCLLLCTSSKLVSWFQIHHFAKPAGECCR